MRLFRSRKVQLSAAAALAASIGLLCPRGAHALAAALVQVANTMSNPAITQPLNTAASQLVLLQPPFNGEIGPGSAVSLQQFQAAGGATYSVPAGESLVVTSVTISNNGPGFASFALTQVNSRGGYTPALELNTAAGTQQFTFPSGIVFPAGTSVGVSDSSGPLIWVGVAGYLTAN